MYRPPRGGKLSPSKYIIRLARKQAGVPPAYLLTHRPVRGGQNIRTEQVKITPTTGKWMGSPRCAGQTRTYAPGWQD
jgi:hypothetical protein